MGCPPPPPPGDGGCDIDAPTFDAGTCPLLGHDESHCMDLVVGSGRDGTLDDFAPFAPGATVYVEPGEQGLQHIVVAFRGSGFDPSRPLIQVRVLDASNCNEVGFIRLRLPFQPDPADPSRLALPAVRVVLSDDANPNEYCTILGRDVNAVVDVSDGQGRSAHRELRLHVGGIDPSVREDVREAWIARCTGGDGGGFDGAMSEAGP